MRSPIRVHQVTVAVLIGAAGGATQYEGAHTCVSRLETAGGGLIGAFNPSVPSWDSKSGRKLTIASFVSDWGSSLPTNTRMGD